MLCGILPSPKTDRTSKNRFESTSNSLKEIAKKNSDKVSYLNIPLQFQSCGVATRNLFKDGIHLNSAGGKKLAKLLVNHVENIEKNKLKN